MHITAPRYRTTVSLLVAIVVILAQGGMPRSSMGQGRPLPPSNLGGSPWNQPSYSVASNDNGIPPTNAATRSASADGFADESMTGDGSAADGSEASSGSGLFSMLRSGGPVMIPIALCSMLIMAVTVERLYNLRRGRIIPRPFVQRFMEKVEEGQLDYDEAVEVCEQFDSPVADVFMAAVKRWGRPAVEVEQAVMDAGQRIADRLRRFLRLFSATANVAPLLGLLGTVLGMIQAFDNLAAGAATAGPEMLAGGISQALITTAAGLCVAIPAYLGHSFFSARADKFLSEIDRLSQAVIESVSSEGLQGKAARRKVKKAA
jgi:biopolymer transport protein ExbB